jgi:hypothetical protein
MATNNPVGDKARKGAVKKRSRGRGSVKFFGTINQLSSYMFDLAGARPPRSTAKLISPAVPLAGLCFDATGSVANDYHLRYGLLLECSAGGDPASSRFSASAPSR